MWFTVKLMVSAILYVLDVIPFCAHIIFAVLFMIDDIVKDVEKLKGAN